MPATLTNSSVPVDTLYPAFETGFLTTLVSGITLTATASTSIFQLPYICVGAKARLIVNVSAITGGTSPSVTVAYNESIDGVTINPTAALTTAALSATGEVWVAAASGPIFNQGQLTFTIAGAPTGITLSAWLAVWNR